MVLSCPYARRDDVATDGVEALVRDLHDHARYYCFMIPNVGSLRETDTGLAEAFSDLHELKVDTAFPFLLELYGDYDRGLLSRDDFVTAVRLRTSVRMLSTPSRRIGATIYTNRSRRRSVSKIRRWISCGGWRDPDTDASIREPRIAAAGSTPRSSIASCRSSARRWPSTAAPVDCGCPCMAWSSCASDICSQGCPTRPTNC